MDEKRNNRPRQKRKRTPEEIEAIKRRKARDRYEEALGDSNNDDERRVKHRKTREDINKIIDNLREDNKLDRELYRDTIDKFDSKLDKFAIALESNNSRLEAIEDDVKSIKERVGV